MEKLIWQHTEDENKSPETISELIQESKKTEERFWQEAEYWELKPDEKTLRHVNPIWEIDLSAIQNRDEYLHWIIEVHSTNWMTTDAFAEFVTATRYLLGNRIHID